MECQHPQESPGGTSCRHLLDNRKQSHWYRFIGKGLEFSLLCENCSGEQHPRIYNVCEECFEDICLSATRSGIQGQPEVHDRDLGLRLEHHLSATPCLDKLIAVVPKQNGWLALNIRRELITIAADARSFERVLAVESSGITEDMPLTLLSPPDRALALVASTYGSRALVLDYHTGKVTARLDRGKHRVDKCRFPVAFAEVQGRLLLVHGSDWNRVDITDPFNGKLLTRRLPTYLDFFQGSLSISPNGEWIASNGWNWHPVGVIATWSLKRWLEDNLWESEDGPTRWELGWRDYYWDGPICWIGPSHLAVWGVGDDDERMLPGIRIFDVQKQEELAGFGGPSVGGRKPQMVISNGRPTQIFPSTGNILFHDFLYSWDEGHEFAVWDVKTGDRLLREENFTPLAYNPTDKTFISQLPDGRLKHTRLLRPA